MFCVFTLMFLLLCVSPSKVTCEMSFCYGYTPNDESKPFECLTEFNSTVCLVCNISDELTGIGWFSTRMRLARDMNNMAPNYPGRLSLTGCRSDIYSLKIMKTTLKNYEDFYFCQHEEHNVSYFVIKIRVHVTLSSEKTEISQGILLINKENKTGRLACSVRGSVPPFTLAWSLNGVQRRRRVIGESHYAPVSFRDTWNISSLKDGDNLSCAVYGRYITSVKKTLLIYEHNKEIRPTVWRVPVRSISFVSSSLLLILVVLGVVCGCKMLRILGRENFNRNDYSVTNGDTVLDDYYYVMEDPYAADEISNILKASFDTKLCVNGLHEYWVGTYSISGTKQGKCFGKQLSNQGTLQEACEFKALARELLALRKSPGVVRVLSVNIVDEPFSIVYEYLDYGLLRDFVLSRYQDLSSETEFGVEVELPKQMKELITFACNVANAMVFLQSQKFCHPFLCLRKVLLTSHCYCKIYDVYPNDLAKMKVSAVFKKTHPPIAWMPPETIFLREYTPASDVWCFSVLLWELFALGGTPYAGSTSKEIEKNIREENLLSRPRNCPESVCDIMHMSWRKRAETRPSFMFLKQKLDEILKSLDGVNSSDGATDIISNYVRDDHI